MSKHTVAIIEDHITYAETLKKIISVEKDMLCTDIFTSGYSAIANIPQLNPDACLVDINLPDMTGIDVLKKLKPQCSDTLFLMCTVHEDDESLFQSLSAGANGYILKSDSPHQIVDAIRSALLGQSPMSAIIAKKVLNYFYQEAQQKRHLDTLTDKENEILAHLSKGLLYKEIADRQHIAIDTVKKHCGAIYRKLHVCNRTEALNLYFKS